MRNIKQRKKKCKHEIVDIGIYDLLKYPHKHSSEKLTKWIETVTNGWKVVPDCPDLHGEFGKEINFNTIDYSWNLLIEFFEPNNSHQIPVIQSKYGDLNSLINYAIRFKEIFGSHDKIAIGPLCRMNNIEIAESVCKIMRKKTNPVFSQKPSIVLTTKTHIRLHSK